MQNNRYNRNRNRQHVPNNRNAYSSNNYGRRETPEHDVNSQQNSVHNSGVYGDYRTAMVMCSILGTQTTVKTRNGRRYMGRTSAFSERGDIALQDGKLIDQNGESSENPTDMVVPKDAFVMCKTSGVDMKGLTNTQDFTDSSIAGKMNGSIDGTMKELQPWQDDDVAAPSLTLDSHSGEGWDPNAMFILNAEKFNVKSSYKEDLSEYTTSLPTPDSEGYEERARLAQKHADEIERSETYQMRISKELTDGDEESRYSSVHRPGDSHPSSHRSHPGDRRNYSRMEDSSHRNGGIRNQGRGLRQNSPYSSHHGPFQSRAAAANSYHSGPPPSSSQQSSMGRNQGPPPPGLHHRQGPPPPQQNHMGSSQYSSQQPQPPPHSHAGLQQQKTAPPMVGGSAAAAVSGAAPLPQRHPPPHHHLPPQMAAPPQKGSALPPSRPQAQGPPSQTLPPPQAQGVKPHSVPPVSAVNGAPPPMQPANTIRQPMSQVNGDGRHSAGEIAQKVTQMELSASGQHSKSPSDSHHAPSAGKSPQAGAEAEVSSSSSPNNSGAPQAASQQGAGPQQQAGAERRAANSEDSRNKIGKQLQDFHENFVLDSQSSGASPDSTSRPQAEPSAAQTSSEPAPAQAATGPPTSGQQTAPVVGPSSSPVVSSSTPASGPPEAAAQAETPAADGAAKSAGKSEDAPLVKESKLNPMAKEFKPSAKPPAPVQQQTPTVVEAQSPSPQPRVSPYQIPYQYPANYMPVNLPGHMPGLMIQQPRKKATVSVDNLTAHQVTGQPLMATQPMIFQTLPHPSGYHQVFNMGNPQARMMGPNSLAMTAQQAQQHGMEQNPGQTQPQPQPVFMTPAHSGLGPMPAHITPHPTPLGPPHPGQPPVPNPAPSPVLQQPQQPGGQPQQQPGGGQHPQALQHHVAQGPPQSATPQPHYPQMGTLQHGIPAIPRTSGMSQPAGAHHPATGPGGTVSIGYPFSMSGAPQYTYTSNPGGQYSFAPQPQTSQNSGHTGGPQPQYVVMPQPQAHPPMQQPGQHYNAPGLQFQGHNIMQGPPQMPPNAGPNPSQGAQHIIHSAGMQGLPAGLHQQVSGTPPAGMFMQGMQPPVCYQRDCYRSSPTVPAPTIMFTLP